MIPWYNIHFYDQIDELFLNNSTPFMKKNFYSSFFLYKNWQKRGKSDIIKKGSIIGVEVLAWVI